MRMDQQEEYGGGSLEPQGWLAAATYKGGDRKEFVFIRAWDRIQRRAKSESVVHILVKES